MKETYDEIH